MYYVDVDYKIFFILYSHLNFLKFCFLYTLFIIIIYIFYLVLLILFDFYRNQSGGSTKSQQNFSPSFFGGSGADPDPEKNKKSEEKNKESGEKNKKSEKKNNTFMYENRILLGLGLALIGITIVCILIFYNPPQGGGGRTIDLVQNPDAPLQAGLTSTTASGEAVVPVQGVQIQAQVQAVQPGQGIVQAQPVQPIVEVDPIEPRETKIIVVGDKVQPQFVQLLPGLRERILGERVLGGDQHEYLINHFILSHLIVHRTFFLNYLEFVVHETTQRLPYFVQHPETFSSLKYPPRIFEVHDENDYNMKLTLFVNGLIKFGFMSFNFYENFINSNDFVKIEAVGNLGLDSFIPTQGIFVAANSENQYLFFQHDVKHTEKIYFFVVENVNKSIVSDLHIISTNEIFQKFDVKGYYCFNSPHYIKHGVFPKGVIYNLPQSVSEYLVNGKIYHAPTSIKDFLIERHAPTHLKTSLINTKMNFYYPFFK